jgi:hypothetical protein
MEDWALILIVFIVLGAVITLVAVLIHSQVRAGIKLPGRAEFYIDASRGGWQVEQQQPRQPRRSGPSGRQLSVKPRFYLEMKHRVCVGRSADNNLRLTDPTADMLQAVIYWQDGRYKISNRSRRIPTRVNGRPIARQNLGDGNTVQLGRTKLIFRDRSRRR